MLKFRQKLDSCSKIYIPKVLREAGFDREIVIALNTWAAVIYPSDVPLDKVLASLSIVRQDLQLAAKESRQETAGPRDFRPRPVVARGRE